MNEVQAKEEAARRWGTNGYAETKQIRGMTVFIVGDGERGLYSSAASSVSWEIAFKTYDDVQGHR